MDSRYEELDHNLKSNITNNAQTYQVLTSGKYSNNFFRGGINVEVKVAYVGFGLKVSCGIPMDANNSFDFLSQVNSLHKRACGALEEEVSRSKKILSSFDAKKMFDCLKD